MLRRLPGSRWAWMLAWASVLPIVHCALVDRDGFAASLHLAARGDWHLAAARLWATLAPRWAAVAAATYAVLHALWAVGQIATRASEASTALATVQLATKEKVSVTSGMGSAAGPLALAGGVGTLAAAAVASWRGAPHLALAPAFALVLLPQMALLWVYLSLMLGLFRLGGRGLALEQYSGDRTLGLRPVGRLAFAGFWSFVANFAPLGILSLGGRSALDLAAVSAFLLLGTFAVFGSLLRVRAQMARAKRKQLARARQLYAEAYEPLRTAPSLEVLQRQAPLLAAADALEKRADAIQTWPFGDALLARAVVIATSVVVAVVSRVLQRALGM